MSRSYAVLGLFATGAACYGLHAARHGDWWPFGIALFMSAIYVAVFLADWAMRRRSADQFDKNFIEPGDAPPRQAEGVMKPFRILSDAPLPRRRRTRVDAHRQPRDREWAEFAALFAEDVAERRAVREKTSEAPAFPEPVVELAPLRERVAIWVVAGAGPWVGIAWAAKALGWV